MIPIQNINQRSYKNLLNPTDQFLTLYDPRRIPEVLENLIPGWRGRDEAHFSQTERALLSLASRLEQGQSARRLRNTAGLEWGFIERVLRKQFPHFWEVIEIIRDAWYLSHHSGAGLQIPPLLLLGDPGLGKTYFATRLAQLLRIEHRSVQMATTTAGFVLSGMSSSWSDAKPGMVFTQLLQGGYANPLLVLDEIDKAVATTQYDALGPLYGLLERHTAQEFRDEYFPLPIDTSRLQWVATANVAEGIPEPIRSRMQVVTIRAPDAAERAQITEQMYQHLLENRPWGWVFHPTLETRVRDRIVERTRTPREIRQALEKLCGATASSQSILDTEGGQELRPGLDHLRVPERLNTAFGFAATASPPLGKKPHGVHPH